MLTLFQTGLELLLKMADEENPPSSESETTAVDVPDKDDDHAAHKIPNDIGDVITIDDSKEPEDEVAQKKRVTVPDAEFFAGVSDPEKEYYREHRLAPDQVEVLKVQCTACWKQVRIMKKYGCWPTYHIL